jgi:hypothetical protein
MTQRFFPEVLCPGCKIKMSVKLILPPRVDIRRMESVVYHCPQCDLETTRHLIPLANTQDGAKSPQSN